MSRDLYRPIDFGVQLQPQNKPVARLFVLWIVPRTFQMLPLRLFGGIGNAWTGESTGFGIIGNTGKVNHENSHNKYVTDQYQFLPSYKVSVFLSKSLSVKQPQIITKMFSHADC